MRRREFITLLGGAVALAARGARAAAGMPVVGFLHPSSPEPFGHIIDGFRRGLNDSRICRRPKRSDRIPLGARRI